MVVLQLQALVLESRVLTLSLTSFAATRRKLIQSTGGTRSPVDNCTKEMLLNSAAGPAIEAWSSIATSTAAYIRLLGCFAYYTWVPSTHWWHSSSALGPGLGQASTDQSPGEKWGHYLWSALAELVSMTLVDTSRISSFKTDELFLKPSWTHLNLAGIQSDIYVKWSTTNL